jgi:hypothetical protein
MANPLVVIVIVALVVAAVVLVRSRTSELAMPRPVYGAEPGAHRDDPQEREVARIASMSAEDRAWEVASLQRIQDMTRRAAGSSEERVALVSMNSSR